MTEERAVLAGGCFWGMQDLLRRYPGVISSRVGYTGGEVRNATYRNHGNHAEAIEITFDPAKTSYRTLLEFFFQIHDPTTPNPPGQRPGRQLSLGDLLHQRRTAEGGRGHDRGRRCLGIMAREGGHRSGAGQRFLGGRARAPGLPGADPERLYLPLRPARLEIAAPRGGGVKSRTGARGTRAAFRPWLASGGTAMAERVLAVVLAGEARAAHGLAATNA